MAYRLEYITTRNADGSIIPAVDFPEPILLDYSFDNYNDADRMRCELCSSMIYGYVKVVEL